MVSFFVSVSCDDEDDADDAKGDCVSSNSIDDIDDDNKNELSLFDPEWGLVNNDDDQDEEI